MHKYFFMFLASPEMAKNLRKCSIMADAAYVILNQNSKDYSYVPLQRFLIILMRYMSIL